ncbi:MAG: hypothetical protein WC375_00150 [Methanomassiliicoccales archaeon]|jgi:hypothetical protein
MGDYSLICAVSGLPITGSHQVVGFETEPYRFKDGKNKFIPASWPVFGEYDMSGGIEGKTLSCRAALIHIDIWNNAEMYWHTENRKSGCNFLNVELAKQKALNEKEFYKEDKKWTDNDYLFYALREQFNKTDEGLVFRELIESEEDATPHPKELCFLFRGQFMEAILRSILSEEWDNERDMKVLHKIVCLYSGQMLTGKFIGPSNDPYIEQYPGYKQRIKIMSKHLAIARKLQKEAK